MSLPSLPLPPWVVCEDLGEFVAESPHGGLWVVYRTRFTAPTLGADLVRCSDTERQAVWDLGPEVRHLNDRATLAEFSKEVERRALARARGESP